MPAVYRVMPQPRSSLVVRGNDPLVTKKPLLPRTLGKHTEE